MTKLFSKFLLLMVLCSIFGTPAHAQKLDTDAFGRLPIQHEGRVKPLRSFAEITLKTLSGKSTLYGRSAEEWLAHTVFDPSSAAQIKIFELTDKTLKAQLSLDEKQKYFSLAELGGPLEQTLPLAAQLATTEPANLTPEQNALLTLHERAALYMKLLRSFSAVLPLDIELPADEDGTRDFITLEPQAKKLEADLKKIIARKGTDASKYSAEEMKIASAAFALSQIRQGGERNDILRVLPGPWEAHSNAWFSPWDMLLSGQGSPQGKALLNEWVKLADAFRENTPQTWNATLSAIETQNKEIAGENFNPARLNAEIFYRAAMPYHWAIGLYVLSVCSMLLLYKRASKFKLSAPLALGLLAMLIHALSIALRIYILGRPPVGTLYESVLFVSLICPFLGALIAIARKDALAMAVGAGAAAALLLISPVALPQGDSLEVLVAVLNTNFWLATHVVCITAGYGVSILTACLAHALLAMKSPPDRLRQNLYQLSLGALFLMVVGTVLGGIWADQSWGRFWGWDPKENGALLICLWLIWVQHGRLSRHLDQTAFTAMLAALNVIVAVSWFGVNLLNVGLHSYGFTSGMASGLAAFCALEFSLIAILWIRKARTS